MSKQAERQALEARRAAARAELLLTSEPGALEAEGEMEKTYRVSQAAIAAAVDVGVAKKAASLALPEHGPYRVRYSRSGREMVLGGERGHVAVVDWNGFAVKAELNVRETVRDVTFLHNNQLFAVAQRRYVYI